MTKSQYDEQGLLKTMDMAWAESQDDDEDDFLAGKTCNPDAPEECESCQ